MRTQEEILKKIESLKDIDFFGFITGDLINMLEYQHAKPFLKDDAKESDWKPNPNTQEFLLKTMEEYMEFAWDKANNCRGLSAGRSMNHYEAWLWLYDGNAAGSIGSLQEYEYYGKDKLVAICEYFKWDHAQWDDGERVNNG